MIKIYTVMSCSSCKKAKEWLESHQLEFEEINLISDKITREDFLKILSLTENGTEEIISKRSRAYQRLDLDFDRLSINELVQIFGDNRTLLRRPLILDDRRLQVGYNEDDIRKFLPRQIRQVEMKTATENVKTFDEERAANS
ncbi:MULTISPECIES: transcriptional regulator Spx [unclassified Lactococcus]|uniref:transcriptional regulator Spx n=1 Tax=unclassified Lactococcus TaxID=2643510 RepID=UPI0011CC6B79|nr:MULTISPECIES: transcriptional regulator Spx [unclassified Lactococcus]MQW22222.1 transcriptional regulator Spx [Lactococcus sp. dk101]TXK45154.1 transcriptional regulator Spx [Lactococcus sp. dk310]TXK51066.1 transcriptional regulator Spx [Lactococcus sp. dk322]